MFYIRVCNLKVWDPNIKVFADKFAQPQGLGLLGVGRSALMQSAIFFYDGSLFARH